MRVLGVDIGTVRLGLAVSDLLGFTAQPLPTREGGGIKKICKTILDVVLEYEKKGSEREKIGTVVVGHPIHLNATESEMSKFCKDCAKRLEEYFKQNQIINRQINVILKDERLTSVAAERVLLSADVSRKKRKEKRDQLAAQIILQGYIDANEKK
jgi:putative Holliday junction resolvase